MKFKGGFWNEMPYTAPKQLFRAKNMFKNIHVRNKM